jgi:hypothetical protein
LSRLGDHRSEAQNRVQRCHAKFVLSYRKQTLRD